MVNMKNLYVYNETNFLITKSIVHKIISAIKKEIGFSIFSLELNFVTKDIITQVNTKFLGHKYATDVITFNYSDESNNFEGEIFICPAVAKENAKKFKVSFDDELRRLIIHGFLHLIGYDDREKKKKQEMKVAEDYFVIKTKRIGRIIK